VIQHISKVFGLDHHLPIGSVGLGSGGYSSYCFSVCLDRTGSIGSICCSISCKEATGGDVWWSYIHYCFQGHSGLGHGHRPSPSVAMASLGVLAQYCPFGTPSQPGLRMELEKASFSNHSPHQFPTLLSGGVLVGCANIPATCPVSSRLDLYPNTH
jgi:hypothetical protein